MNWFTWLTYLWPGKRRERIAEEKKTDEMFRAQLNEALLRQDDLREAVAQMKRSREEQTVESKRYRASLSSRPAST